MFLIYRQDELVLQIRPLVVGQDCNCWVHEKTLNPLTVLSYSLSEKQMQRSLTVIFPVAE